MSKAICIGKMGKRNLNLPSKEADYSFDPFQREHWESSGVGEDMGWRKHRQRGRRGKRRPGEKVPAGHRPPYS